MKSAAARTSIIVILLCLLLLTPSLFSTVPALGAETAMPKDAGFLELSDQWQFSTDQENVGMDRKWYVPEFDDRTWTTISSHKAWENQGFKDYDGYGWYRQRIDVSSDMLAKTDINMIFLAVDEQAWVFINGQKAYENTTTSTSMTADRLWDRPFMFDAKPFLEPGSNLVCVRAHDSMNAGGIWRPHYLVWGKDLDRRKVLDIVGIRRPDMGWKEHFYRVGDGKGGWVVRRADYQFMHHPSLNWTAGYGLARMDNGEIILMGAVRFNHNTPNAYERTIYCFSSDNGDTWTDWRMFDDPGATRPIYLAYLGKGRLTFLSAKRFFSSDYGRTWQSIPDPDGLAGMPFSTEGNSLVDYDKSGSVTRMAEIGYRVVGNGEWWTGEGLDCSIRWSDDGGRTWRDRTSPQAWRYEVEHNGKTYAQAGSEGSITRARNGWLIAAFRTTMLPKFRVGGAEGVDFNDSLEGTGISISRDDGKTWSPIKVVFDGGRHHAHLLTLPNGDIVMTLTVRVDVRDGELASYRRGCDAIISKDNGLTWNLNQRIVLDEYEFYDGNQWFNGECGHLYSIDLKDGRILTVTNNYMSKGMSLIRWSPE